MNDKEKTCVIHADRPRITTVVGISVCKTCLDEYQVERRSTQDFRQRRFYRKLLRVHHKLEAMEREQFVEDNDPVNDLFDANRKVKEP